MIMIIMIWSSSLLSSSWSGHHHYHHHDLVITIIIFIRIWSSSLSSSWSGHHHYHHHQDLVIIIIIIIRMAIGREKFSTVTVPADYLVASDIRCWCWPCLRNLKTRINKDAELMTRCMMLSISSQISYTLQISSVAGFNRNWWSLSLVQTYYCLPAQILPDLL